MKRKIVGLLFIMWAALVYAGPASATCTIPNQLSNGDIADATAVMGNFNALANCTAGIDQTAWTAYTPTIGAYSGAFTTVSAAGRYKQLGKTVCVAVQVTVTSNGSAAGYITATLPAAAISSGFKQILAGKETAAVGFGVAAQINSGATSVILVKAIDGSYPGANGYVLEATGCYEAA